MSADHTTRAVERYLGELAVALMNLERTNEVLFHYQ